MTRILKPAPCPTCHHYPRVYVAKLRHSEVFVLYCDGNNTHDALIAADPYLGVAIAKWSEAPVTPKLGRCLYCRRALEQPGYDPPAPASLAARTRPGARFCCRCARRMTQILIDRPPAPSERPPL